MRYSPVRARYIKVKLDAGLIGTIIPCQLKKHNNLKKIEPLTKNCSFFAKGHQELA